MKNLSFLVAGVAKPAGSKRGFFIPKLKRVIITDACKGSKDWKTDVKIAAQTAYSGSLLTGPIELRLTFYVMRPKGHFGSGKNSAELKLNAPQFPTTRPDVLKLARGVEDAMTGIIYADDSQIVTEYLYKRYSPRPGCLVEIKEAGELAIG